MAHQVKDPVLSLLWLGFDPWPGNSHMLQAWQKKKKTNKKQNKKTQSQDDALSVLPKSASGSGASSSLQQPGVVATGGSLHWSNSVALPMVMAGCPLSFNSSMFSKTSW